MSGVTVRHAREEDAPFLAWAMQEADRGQTGIGSWDVMIPEGDERLRNLERLAKEGEGTICHWSTFLIGEIDGVPSATAAAFVPSQIAKGSLPAVMRRITGWSEKQLADAESGAFSREYFQVPLPPDTWRVEWVATRPESRGRGLNAKLLAELLDWGRRECHKTSHVGTYLGNEPAIAAYEAAGFEAYAEARHADFERVFRCPGLIFFRRDL